jgi:hypothetical protein
MTIQDLEKRITELEETIKSQAAEIRKFNDIEEINRLQRAYGYYLEHWMTQDVIDLFSDSPDASVIPPSGVFLGKTGITRYFEHNRPYLENNRPDNEYLHQVMQVSGIVDVAPDGKTAKGRWYGFGAIATPYGKCIRQSFLGGIYTADYIKENGIWKFLKLRFDILYRAAPAEGWVKPERLASIAPTQSVITIKADAPLDYNARYPSGYIVPFHFKHPVTGKKTSENEWNSSLDKSNNL